MTRGVLASEMLISWSCMFMPPIVTPVCTWKEKNSILTDTRMDPSESPWLGVTDNIRGVTALYANVKATGLSGRAMTVSTAETVRDGRPCKFTLGLKN